MAQIVFKTNGVNGTYTIKWIRDTKTGNYIYILEAETSDPDRPITTTPKGHGSFVDAWRELASVEVGYHLTSPTLICESFKSYILLELNKKVRSLGVAGRRFYNNQFREKWIQAIGPTRSEMIA